MSRKRVDLLLENMTIEACAAEGKALTHWNGAVVRIASSRSASISEYAEGANGSRFPIISNWKPNVSRSKTSWCAWDILKYLKSGLLYLPIRPDITVTSWNSLIRLNAGS